MRFVNPRGINPLDRHGVDGHWTAPLAVPTSVRLRTTTSIHFAFTRSIQMYTMYETLARERTTELQRQAARWRLSNELASARLWQRLASYTARRAARSRRRVADSSAADYQLAA